MSNTFVVLMGMGTVFIGLICIIFVCTIMSALVNSFSKKDQPTNSSDNTQNKTPQSPNRAPDVPITPEFVAAVTAAIAEYSGKDISGIRIHSIKKEGQTLSVGAGATSDTSAGSPGFIAAITAAIAEYTGKDYSGIRILSIKKI